MKMDIIRPSEENFLWSLSQIDKVGLNALEKLLEETQSKGSKKSDNNEEEFNLNFETDEEDDD